MKDLLTSRPSCPFLPLPMSHLSSAGLKLFYGSQKPSNRRRLFVLIIPSFKFEIQTTQMSSFSQKTLSPYSDLWEACASNEGFRSPSLTLYCTHHFMLPSSSSPPFLILGFLLVIVPTYHPVVNLCAMSCFWIHEALRMNCTCF